LPDSNLSQTLYITAEAYLAQNYSVIPVWGESDPARPKVAGVEWNLYQRRRPTLSEIHKWFIEDGFGGIAIVTGRISKIAVLDFDIPEGFRDFSAQYPELVEHHVIQTKRGYHIYFHLPPHLHLSSRKGGGIDLLVEGRYVIARPTCIDGHTYKLIRGGQPKTLTAFDIQRITHFFDGQARIVALPASKREFMAFALDSDNNQPLHKIPPVLKTQADLHQIYREGVKKGRGRNEALFQASLKARDDGWSAEQTLAALADLHVRQPTSGSHRPETAARRYQEARKTVQSAFSRSPCRLQPLANADDRQTIPTSVRECLFQMGETRVVRLLDGLRLKGIKPGEVFITSQALELLKGVVGRDSIYTALKAQTVSGEAIFKRQNPSPAPLTPANAAIDTKTETNKCFIGRAKKPGISPNHRPATLYIMPSNDELCLGLGVKLSRSDPMTLNDLATAKQTRQAAYRELVRRRPAKYPRRWLAYRLGISCVTLDSYTDQVEGLHSHPCFWEQKIYWSNLNAVPDEMEIMGAVLADETGKRYPAKRKIAAFLLGKGRRVVYKRQDANYYWYSDSPIEISVTPGLHPKWRELEVQPRALNRVIRQPYTIGDAVSALIQSDHARNKIEIDVRNNQAFLLKTPSILTLAPNTPAKDQDVLKSSVPASHKTACQPNYHKPLKDASKEALALRVYNAINQDTSDQANRISQASARRLVDMYGVEQVEQGLDIIGKRRAIINPAGFLVTWLRSESRRDQFAPLFLNG
jgi:hypothetical protein